MATIYRQKNKDGTLRSKYWWLTYSRGGKQYFESSKTELKSIAKKLLDKRKGEIAEGKFPGLAAYKTKVSDLLKLYINEYEFKNRVTLAEAKRYADLLNAHFGHMLAANVTSQDIMEYRLWRRAGGTVEKKTDKDKKPRKPRKVTDGTINLELAGLKHAYNLGLRQDPPKVSRVPYIELVSVNNVRSGFFEPEDFLALRGLLPDHLKVVASVGYYTGMRLGRILNLRWDQVDLERRVLKLGPYSHYGPWRTACKKAGFTNRTFHDFRRSAVLNLVRAGVPERVAMMITGHKTRSVFDRYNIVSGRDLSEAAERLSQYIKSNSNADHYKTIIVSEPEKTESLELIEN